MNAVIETLGLTKTYRTVTGRVIAADRIDLDVPPRGLHVLLGPTKAGKSTLLRLLVGLAVPDAGAARVLGVPAPDTGRELAGRVGTVIGEPDFIERLSGRRNLLMHPTATGKAQVDHVLGQAGLTNVAQNAVGSYTPGARRRLTIAAGLLAGTELLLVDDATRGLDAEDTREVRTLLRKLADRGPAVVLTGDNLVEAQQIADTVTLLSGGRALADGPAADVIGEVATSVRVRVDDAKRAVAELTAAKFTATRDGETVVVDGVAEPADVTKALARKKLYVTEMSTRAESLEALVRRLEPERKPEPKREPKPAAKPATKSEPKSVAKAAAKPVTNAAAKSAANAEQKATTKAAAKPATKPEPKAAAKPEPGSEPKPAAGERSLSWRERRRAAFEADAAAKRDRYAARVAAREQAAVEKAEALRAKQEAQEEREFERMLKAEQKASDKEERKKGRAAKAKALLGNRAAQTQGGANAHDDDQDVRSDPVDEATKATKAAKAAKAAKPAKTETAKTAKTAKPAKTEEPAKEEA